MPSTTESPPSAGSGASGLRPSSGSAVTEGCIPVKASGQELSCCFKFVADEAEAEEPSSHGVFGVFVLLGFGAGGFYRLSHLAQGQAKLDVTLKLACVEAVLAAAVGSVELEKPELDRAFSKGGVQVQHVVAAVVVMLVSAVVGTIASVPNVR